MSTYDYDDPDQPELQLLDWDYVGGRPTHIKFAAVTYCVKRNNYVEACLQEQKFADMFKQNRLVIYMDDSHTIPVVNTYMLLEPNPDSVWANYA